MRLKGLQQTFTEILRQPMILNGLHKGIRLDQIKQIAFDLSVEVIGDAL